MLNAHFTYNAPKGFEWVAHLIPIAFGGVFLFLGATLVGKALITRFGHSEIIVTPGRIRSVERVGFIFHASSRVLASLTRLEIVKPEAGSMPDGELLMNLEAYFSDSMPFFLGQRYPVEALKPIAKELIG